MPTMTQSVIIPKSKFTEKQANKWILKNKYSDKGKRIKNYKTTNFYRFRQMPPSHFAKGSMKTKMLKNGIGIVYGNHTKNMTKK